MFINFFPTGFTNICSCKAFKLDFRSIVNILLTVQG